ncbi:MAG: CHC2 zinc finger domain-containing protein [Lachnospiraceae bacterium]|nr:CHC2 zinc finger domain-containing protein [Lachnospiraceae bacterium]
MNVFEAVRNSVTARKAAESYGIKVNRNGMACCPFHNDKHPSMKLDRRFHCFSCQADGDAISFVSRYFNLKPIEAAKKLADDFGIAYDEKDWNPSVARPKPRVSSELEEKKKEVKCFQVFCDYLRLVEQWQEEFKPEVIDDECHPLFVEAMQNKNLVEYVLDDIFLNGSAEEKKAFISQHEKEITALERRLQKFDVGKNKKTEKSLCNIAI